MKFLKKNGMASYSGGMVIVAGTPGGRVHMKFSKSNICSIGSGFFSVGVKAMSWSPLSSDGLRDALELSI